MGGPQVRRGYVQLQHKHALLQSSHAKLQGDRVWDPASAPASLARQTTGLMPFSLPGSVTCESASAAAPHASKCHLIGHQH